MAAIIKQLKNKAGQLIYPVTRSKAVYMSNGFSTVDNAIMDLMDGNTDISFKDDGSIETVLESGNKVTMTFPSGQPITETCVDTNGKLVYTKTTAFNSDGSISIRVVYPEG